MPYKVYLGDTSPELQKLRPILIDQIRQWGMTPLELTAEERQNPAMLDILKRKISEADYFISIVTYRRAWEPDDMGGKSLAEIEFDLALTYGKPFVVLLPGDNSPMGMYLRLRALGQSGPDRAAQRAFWGRVKDTGSVVYFSDEADLSRKLMQTLMQWGARLDEPFDAAALAPAESTRPGLPGAPPSVDVLADRIADRVAMRLIMAQQQRQEDLAEQALKVNEALRLQPGELVFGRPSERSQFRSDVFMIMPFTADFTSIYADIIRPLMDELKLTIQRGDDFVSTQGVIMEEVWSALNACRFVIVEITGGNDNVFYELGIAHTLNKPAILITQARTPEGIPFNIRHLRYIQYDNTAAGGMKLRDDLRRAVTRLLSDLEEGWGKTS